MKIQVLGSGCPACKQLFEITKKMAKELNIDTEVEYITDVSRMIEMGVMTSPVLAIDGKPVLIGGNKREEEIKEAISGTINNIGNKNGCENCSCGGDC
ncbi:MAG: MTH895/ArsE family thioredoxin-like protein [Patescibacteria group bacterium]|jgi:small redox-active disulfide protein 2|nr:MTH895/ArsE family thioredoxin-like protein [Patescibacteria group bacterium]